MKYSELIKFCRNVNNDPIFQEYSCGIRCNCFRDVHNVYFLEVIHFGAYVYLRSTKCNNWDEDFILEWIIDATRELKLSLGLGGCET